jgi:ATP-binding cassette subfamily B protein
MFKDELPTDVYKELDRRGLNGVPVVLCTTSELSLSGRPERNWIVATRYNVAAVREGETGRLGEGETTSATVQTRISRSPVLPLCPACHDTDAAANSPSVVVHVPVAEVREFRTHSTVGSGFLQAYVDDYWVDLARFPNTEADRFSRLARYLEDLRTEGEVQIETDSTPKVTHCPKCTQRLPVANESCPRCIPRKAILGRLVQMLWPYRATALLMCGLMLVAVAAELTPPKLQQYLVDHILRGGQASPDPRNLFTALFAVVCALAVTRLALSGVNFAKGRMATRVGVALTYDFRARLVQKLHSLGLEYYDRHQVGSTMSRVAYDSEVIQSLLHQITGGFLLQIVQVMAVGVMLFTLNPKLAVYTLIPAPLVIIGSWFFWKRVHPRHYRYWDSSSKQAGMLTGMLSGIRVVKAFAQEDREYERYNRISGYLRDCRMHVDYSTAAFSATMQLIVSLGGLIVWYIGGHDVLAGTMSLGSLIAFLAYLAMFYTPLATLSQFTTWLTNFLTGCQRVFELLDTPVEVKEAAEPVKLRCGDGEMGREGDKGSKLDPRKTPPLPLSPSPSLATGGGIRFENVTFGYERHQPVLRDINFEIRAGETVGIVGRSGSGKTTLINLLCRFYDTCEGRVLVDGVDVRQVASHDLRQHIGVVLQEPFLFRGTIWDNLVYGMPTSSPERAVAAAKAAQAHDFILNSPLGYDTWLGERGAGLSGGERQRMSIARAILYDPPILVLDEATSNVDAESEQVIQQALRALTKGRTTIAIAHRLSTLREADRILVFDRGRLIEQGSHDELIACGGQYASLVRLQGDARTVENDKARMTNDECRCAASDVRHSSFDIRHSMSPHWLMPGDIIIRSAIRGGVEVKLRSADVRRGVFAVNLFPATEPDDYISLRVWDREGNEQEIGILRHLDDWPMEAQILVRAALERRYWLQTITGVDNIELELGHLTLSVRTLHGLRKFTMRWSQSQVQDFGELGKVLLDLDDNRYLVPNVEALPPKEQELFLRYVYW